MGSHIVLAEHDKGVIIKKSEKLKKVLKLYCKHFLNVLYYFLSSSRDIESKRSKLLLKKRLTASKKI
ncbi:hypothetical protein A8F94_06445 [Bacillus sp. FJAT-27225]|nr:hypothetical protein A8F94_06445 [Bacillus sp. FJAT-27225]